MLPRLGKHVLPVYVEATPEETEARLLKGLRKVCPELARRAGASSRRWQRCGAGGVLRPGQKVLLVLDQFEQWLFARRDETNTELVAALRQCDGEHVQALVMVRDDFWMAATRFMRDLEIRLVEGENSAAVDLFDLLHARKVLDGVRPGLRRLAREVVRAHARAASVPRPGGRRAGPGRQGDLGAAGAVRRDGQGEALDAGDLEGVGGTEGVGVTFLEETFSATTAPPEHRLHQKAAQAVLKALLPETGTDIKGQMRSEAELREASGYASRPRDFDDLIGILDPELRLITPTDPEGSAGRGASPARPGGQRYLPAHPRLPGPLAARLADPQAARDPPGPGRAAAGRTRGDLGRQAGEPPPAFGLGVGEHPDAEPPQGLDRPAAADDAAGGAGAWPAGTRCRRADRAD